MSIDVALLNLPVYSVSELLNRLNDLMKLTKSGFRLPMSEVTLGTQQGNFYTGYVTSFESGSITLIHKINEKFKRSVMVLDVGHIVSIQFDYDEQINELFDSAQPLPYSVDMGPLDLKRMMLKCSEEIGDKINSKIQIENTLKAKAENISHLCNVLNLVKQSIIRIAVDDPGKESLRENVTKIQLREAETVGFKLQDKTLLFSILPTGQNFSLSTVDASEQISRLL